MLARAASELAGELDLDSVLEILMRTSAEVTGARYAALGVLGEGERISRFVTHGVDADTVRAIGYLPKGEGLLGLLIRHPQVLRLDHLSQHPTSAGFPANHPPMTSFLGAPVRSDGRVFGNFYLTDKPGGFDEVDEYLIEVLAAQAGAAVENADLSAQLRDLAVADEGERISRELHDGVIQWLFSIGMGTESARALLPDDPQRVDERLESAVDGLDGAIRELRAAIFRLRPQRTVSLGLAAGLRELAREYELNALIRPDLDVHEGIDAHVPLTVVPDTLQFTREALSNVARHAGTTQVHVRATVSDDRLELQVVDHGAGFDLDRVASGLGLETMRERATALGGDLRMDTRPGRGATVQLRAPLRTGDAQEDSAG